jgi:DNA repair photolyase
MEAVAALNESGIPCGVLVAPLMPGINDAPEQVEEILRLAEEAGATGIGGIALHLRADVKEIFFDWLRSHRPDLLPRYEKLYARGAYAPQAERERLSRMVGRGPRWPSDLRGVDEAKRRQDAANLARRAGRPAPAAREEVADTQQALF